MPKANTDKWVVRRYKDSPIISFFHAYYVSETTVWVDAEAHVSNGKVVIYEFKRKPRKFSTDEVVFYDVPTTAFPALIALAREWFENTEVIDDNRRIELRPIEQEYANKVRVVESKYTAKKFQLNKYILGAMRDVIAGEQHE